MVLSRDKAGQREREVRRARSEHESRLAQLCAQMMGLECGLRRKERELSAALRQRERTIKEQSRVIHILLDTNTNHNKVDNNTHR